MKLILHHFWKDVRLMRWMLGFWLVLLLAQAVFSCLSVQPAHIGANDSLNFSNSANIVYLVANWIWFLMIVRLVQADPVIGTVSFWRTRPIPPLVSAASKLIFIAGLLILPSLLVRWLDFYLLNVEAEAVHDMTSMLLVVDLLVLVLVVWLATYTRSMVQFWAAICGVGLALFAYHAIASANHGTSILSGTTGMDIGDLAAMLIWGGTILSLVVQYGFCRTRLAFRMGLISLVLGFIACIFGSWSQLIVPKPSSRPEGEVRRDVAYQLGEKNPVSWSDNNPFQSPGAVVPLYPAMLKGLNVPFPESIEWSFQPDDGERSFTSECPKPVLMGNIDWTPTLQNANPALTIAGQASGPGYQTVRLSVSPENERRIRGKAGTLSFDIHGAVLTLNKVAEIPLDNPGSFSIPNFAMKISSVSPDGSGGMTLQVDGVGYVQSLPDYPSQGMQSNLQFLLVDWKNHVGILPQQMDSSTTTGLSGLGSWNRIFESRTIGFNSHSFWGPAWDKIRPEIRDDRPGDWTLYIFTVSKGAPFESKVIVPNLTL